VAAGGLPTLEESGQIGIVIHCARLLPESCGDGGMIAWRWEYGEGEGRCDCREVASVCAYGGCWRKGLGDGVSRVSASGREMWVFRGVTEWACEGGWREGAVRVGGGFGDVGC
jgi:hypothetical protein